MVVFIGFNEYHFTGEQVKFMSGMVNWLDKMKADEEREEEGEESPADVKPIPETLQWLRSAVKLSSCTESDGEDEVEVAEDMEEVRTFFYTVCMFGGITLYVLMFAF